MKMFLVNGNFIAHLKKFITAIIIVEYNLDDGYDELLQMSNEMTITVTSLLNEKKLPIITIIIIHALKID